MGPVKKIHFKKGVPMAFINIADSKDAPVYIDPASVTSVFVNYNAVKKEHEIALNNAKGQFLYRSRKDGEDGIDPEKLLKALADAGNTLVTLSGSSGDKDSTRYISPAAVNYVTWSEPNKDGTVSTVFSVAGDRVDSHGTKPEELKAVLDGIKAAGTKMVEFNADEARASWMRGGGLMVDPKRVEMINVDLIQVSVHFPGGDWLPLQQPERDDRENDLLNELWDDGKGKYKTPNDAWREARRVVKEEEMDQRNTIAKKVGDATGLTMITGTKWPSWVNPAAYSTVHFWDDKDRKDAHPDQKFIFTLQPQRTRENPYPREVRAYFNTAALRDASFAALNAPKAEKPKAKAKPAPKTP